MTFVPCEEPHVKGCLSSPQSVVEKQEEAALTGTQPAYFATTELSLFHTASRFPAEESGSSALMEVKVGWLSCKVTGRPQACF